MRVVDVMHEERARRRSLADRSERVKLWKDAKQAIIASPPTSEVSPASPRAFQSPDVLMSPAMKSGSSPGTPGSIGFDSPATADWLASSTQLVQTLLAAGASVGIRDNGGADALTLATDAPSMVRLLRQAKEAHPERHAPRETAAAPAPTAVERYDGRADKAKAAKKVAEPTAVKAAAAADSVVAADRAEADKKAATPTNSLGNVSPDLVTVDVVGGAKVGGGRGGDAAVPAGGGCCVLQ